MKTKVILLAVIAILAMTEAKAQEKSTIIDFDYQKAFPLDLFGIDANMNGVVDDDEAFSLSSEGNQSTFYINYKDFGSAGSLMDVETVAKNEKGNIRLKGSLEDVTLVRNEKQSVIVYICHNKLGEIQFIVSDDKGNDQVTVWVENPAFLKMVK